MKYERASVLVSSYYSMYGAREVPFYPDLAALASLPDDGGAYWKSRMM
jgi:hypothetical protein